MTENVQFFDWIGGWFQFQCRDSKLLTAQVFPQVIVVAQCMPFAADTGCFSEGCGIAIGENAGNDIVHYNDGG